MNKEDKEQYSQLYFNPLNLSQHPFEIKRNLEKQCLVFIQYLFKYKEDSAFSRDFIRE